MRDKEIRIALTISISYLVSFISFCTVCCPPPVSTHWLDVNARTWNVISLRFACWWLCGTRSQILKLSTSSNQVSPWTPIFLLLILTFPSRRHSTIADNNEEQDIGRTVKSHNRDTAPCFICYHLSILSDVPSDWRVLIKLGTNTGSFVTTPSLSFLSSWHQHLSSSNVRHRRDNRAT